MKHKNKVRKSMLRSDAKDRISQIESELVKGPRDLRDEQFYDRLGKEKHDLETAFKVKSGKKKK